MSIKSIFVFNNFPVPKIITELEHKNIQITFFFFYFGEIVNVPVISFLMVSELFVIISNRRYDNSTLLNGIRFCLCGSKLL